MRGSEVPTLDSKLCGAMGRIGLWLELEAGSNVRLRVRWGQPKMKLKGIFQKDLKQGFQLCPMRLGRGMS